MYIWVSSGRRLAWIRTPAFHAGNPGFKSRRPHQQLLLRFNTMLVKCLNIKLYVVSSIILFLLIFPLLTSRNFYLLSMAMSFLIFIIFCLVTAYSFTSKFGKDFLSLIFSLTTVFIIFHYLLLFSAFQIGYFSFFVVQTCSGKYCSVALDWGQIFLVFILACLALTLYNTVRKAKRI